MNSHSKPKGHPAFATAPAEGVTVVLQCAPALPPAGQAAGGTQSPLTTSSKATVTGGRGRTCSCCTAVATYMLWRTCRRAGSGTSPQDTCFRSRTSKSGSEKPSFCSAKTSPPEIRPQWESWKRLGTVPAATPAAGSNRRPVPNAGQEREVIMRNPMAARRRPAGEANLRAISPGGVVFTGVAAITTKNQIPAKRFSEILALLILAVAGMSGGK